MATIAHTTTEIKTFRDNSHVLEWKLLTPTNNVGDAIEMPGSSDRSIQVDGTWDGATLVFEGSNDGATWFTLTDPQGNAISKTVDSLEMIEELTRYVRPRISVNGAGGASLNARLLVKRVS